MIWPFLSTFYSEGPSHLFLKAQTQDSCVCHRIKTLKGRFCRYQQPLSSSWYSSTSLLEELSKTPEVFPQSSQSAWKPPQPVGAEFPAIENKQPSNWLPQRFQRSCACQTSTTQYGSTALGNTCGSLLLRINNSPEGQFLRDCISAPITLLAEAFVLLSHHGEWNETCLQ